MEDLRQYIDIKNPPKTREGNTVVIYTTTAPGDEPIHGAIDGIDGPQSWQANGRYYNNQMGFGFDLMIDVPKSLPRPKKRDYYWAINIGGEIIEYCWDNDVFDRSLFEVGNVFLTKAAAERHAQALKDRQTIRELIVMASMSDILSDEYLCVRIAEGMPLNVSFNEGGGVGHFRMPKSVKSYSKFYGEIREALKTHDRIIAAFGA